MGIHNSGREPVLEDRGWLEPRESIVGIQKAQSAGWCWPVAPPLRGPLGLLEEVLLIEGAGAKVLGLRGFSIQLEAGGQVGEVPEAVSWEWLPGAPCFVQGPTCM